MQILKLFKFQKIMESNIQKSFMQKNIKIMLLTVMAINWNLYDEKKIKEIINENDERLSRLLFKMWPFIISCCLWKI